jgi:hypothetical protein
VAEELLFAEVTGGAANDFEKATSIATTMVVRFGMGSDPESTDHGATGRGILTTLVGTESVAVNSAVKDAQARAIRHILDEAYSAARRTLITEMARLRAVAGYLYEQERIDGDEFDSLMAGVLAPLDTEGWRAAAASPRPWDSIEPLFARPGLTAVPAVVEAPAPIPLIEVPVPVVAALPGPAPVLPPPPSVAPRTGPPPRRYRGARRLPALPIRLRRTFAAMVRELADEGER